MPLYEYQCDACGHRFETIQKFSDPPVSTCPSCSGQVRKLLSSPAIQFKGSGWYITDYARKNGSDSSKSGSSPSPSSNGSGDSAASSSKGDSTSTGATSSPKTDSTQSGSE